jgi:hypothetical protein
MFSRAFFEIYYQQLIHVMKELRIESVDGVLSRRKLHTVIEYIMENGEIPEMKLQPVPAFWKTAWQQPRG